MGSGDRSWRGASHGGARWNQSKLRVGAIYAGRTWACIPVPDPVLKLLYPRHRRWKIRHRFSDEEIAQVVRTFKAGTPKHVLATRSVSSSRFSNGSLTWLAIASPA